MKLKQIWLAIFAILFTYSVVMACDPEKKARKPIVGKWEMYQMDCCGRTTKTTKAKPGDKTMIFDIDGKVEISTPEGKVTSNYTFVEKKADFDQPLLNLGRENAPAMYTLKGDTLTVSWGYMDLQTEYYTRKK